MPTDRGAVDAAIERFKREVSDAIPAAIVLHDPNDRYGTYDAVLTVTGPMWEYDDLPPTVLQQAVRSIHYELGVRLFVLYMEPQLENEPLPTDGHIAKFGPRGLVEAAEACVQEIERRLPGTQARWVHDSSRDGFAARIEVFGPWSCEDEDEDNRVSHALYEATEAVQEKFGLSFVALYRYAPSESVVATADGRR